MCVRVCLCITAARPRYGALRHPRGRRKKAYRKIEGAVAGGNRAPSARYGGHERACRVRGS